MSKPSRHPNREEIKARRKERKRAQKALREELKGKGCNISSHSTISNHKCEFRTGAVEDFLLEKRRRTLGKKVLDLVGRARVAPEALDLLDAGREVPHRPRLPGLSV